MVEILWTVLSLCGVAIAVYGVFLFFAVPAAGVVVTMTGIVVSSVGVRKNDLLNARLAALMKIGTKGESDTLDGNLLIPKSFKIVAFLYFVTSVYLVSSIIPNFDSLGDEIGFLVSTALGVVGALFFTGLILSVFRTSKSLVVVLLVTWAAILIGTVS